MTDGNGRQSREFGVFGRGPMGHKDGNAESPDEN